MGGGGTGSTTHGGTYTLLVELDTATTIQFGAAGERSLASGWYAYTGSALGSGGFARVDRHYRLASGEHDARHWHVDYLLGHPEARLEADVRSQGVDAECEIAREIAERASPVRGVGATDCDCASHLAYAGDDTAVKASVRQVHERARD